MSEDIERAFVTLVSNGGEKAYRLATKAGVVAGWFGDERARDAWVQMGRYHMQHRSVPSVEVLNHMTGFVPVPSSDALTGLIERLRAQALYGEMGAVLEQIRVSTMEDPEAGLDVMRKEITRLTVGFSHNGDTWDREEAVRTAVQRYMGRKEGGGLVGLPWPWDILNDWTGGVRAADYVVMNGRRKSFKSWLLLFFMLYLYQTRGTTFLLLFKEMTLEIWQDRFLALWAGVPWREFERGLLTPEQETAIRRSEEEIIENSPYWIHHADKYGADAAVEVQRYLDEHEPDIVAYDGMYLVDPMRKHESLTAFSTTLRGILDRYGVPLIGTVQTNREGNIGYSDAFEQDCTLNMRLDRPEERKSEIVVSAPAGRNVPPDMEPFVVKCFPAVGFTFDRLVDSSGVDGADELVGDGDDDITAGGEAHPVVNEEE